MSPSIRGARSPINAPNGSIVQQATPLANSHENGGLSTSPSAGSQFDTLSHEIDALMDNFDSSDDNQDQADDDDSTSSSSSSGSSSSGTDSENEENFDTTSGTAATAITTTTTTAAAAAAATSARHGTISNGPRSMNSLSSMASDAVGNNIVSGQAARNSSVEDTKDVEEIAASDDDETSSVNEPMEEEEQEEREAGQENLNDDNKKEVEEEGRLRPDYLEMLRCIGVESRAFMHTAYDTTDHFVDTIMMHIMENQTMDQDTYESIENETSLLDPMEGVSDDIMITDNYDQEEKFEDEGSSPSSDNDDDDDDDEEGPQGIEGPYQMEPQKEEEDDIELDRVKSERSTPSLMPDLSREATFTTSESMESTPEFGLVYENADEDADEEPSPDNWETYTSE